ncbi:MAG TPA: metal ABC transporter ATP-binding protein [Actinomycetota bacterium]|nr:metal ABC transporter ATP-binding protein [Actinomycetota bacterium]
MTPHAIAQLIDVDVSLGQQEVLKGLSLRFNQGEFVAILGSNGSGKTTLVRALLGLLTLDSGEIRLFGTPLGRFKEWRRIGYVPQRFGATSGVPATVEEVVLTGRISVAKRLRGFSSQDREAALKALDAMGLADVRRRRVSHLSGGQQQRVLIARALVNEPDFLLLDEPVSSVDLENQEMFAQTLERLSEAKASVLLVAHALGAMEPLVHRTVVLEQGQVAYDGPPSAEFQDEHAHHPHGVLHTGGLPKER